MNELKIKLESVSPLLMHRYIGEQPTMDKPRKKTQDWIDKMHKQDWMNSAYWDDQVGFFLPAENIEAMTVVGAKRMRMGETFKYVVACVEDRVPVLLENGKPAKGKLLDYYIPEHIDLRGAKIQNSRIDRCRPIFRKWSLVFTLLFEEVEEKHVMQALTRNSLGDFRPRFGRFTAAKV